MGEGTRIEGLAMAVSSEMVEAPARHSTTSAAAIDVYKRQGFSFSLVCFWMTWVSPFLRALRSGCPAFSYKIVVISAPRARRAVSSPS